MYDAYQASQEFGKAEAEDNQRQFHALNLAYAIAVAGHRDSQVVVKTFRFFSPTFGPVAGSSYRLVEDR